ncbi:hypothetical protein B2M26_08165 [Ferroacidibacillus organovorans]|nr:hypothetical protein B2M26_08165 [Ferroacidibacillus organovorans]
MASLLLTGCSTQIPVLQPQGPVAQQEFGLIEWSFFLMLIVAIVVFILFGVFIYRYRNTPNNKAPYEPDMEGSRKLEFIWTLIPVVIVLLIAVPTVRTTYALQAPPSTAKTDPLVINVTSAAWKWVFQYPKSGLETVNYLVIPANEPVQFNLTSVGPMNTFWIPSLGGMEFNMPNVTLGLWLQADHPGIYLGRSANFSGVGFEHMSFTVKALSIPQFNTWVSAVKKTAPALSSAENNQILYTHGLSPKLTFSSYPSTTATGTAGMSGM